MAAKATSRQNHFAMMFMGAVLVFGAVTAVTQPAGEFPPRFYALFNIALDAVMTLLMVALLIAEGKTPASGLKWVAVPVGVVGLLAGALQVVIRFTSDHAWWTGNYAPPVFN